MSKKEGEEVNEREEEEKTEGVKGEEEEEKPLPTCIERLFSSVVCWSLAITMFCRGPHWHF